MPEQGGRITRARDWIVGIASVIAAIAAVLSVPDHSVNNLPASGNNQPRAAGQVAANQAGAFTPITPTPSTSYFHGPQNGRSENGVPSTSQANSEISPASGSVATVANQKFVSNGSVGKQQSSAQLVTRYIAEHQEPSGCGSIPEVYCEADIVRAAERYALQIGNDCDIGISTGEACPINSEAVVVRKEHEIELQTLERKRVALEGQLSSVALSPPSSFHEDMESCERRALNSGLRSEVYQQYTMSTCLPEARAARAKPLKDLLDRVDSKISQISQYK